MTGKFPVSVHEHGADTTRNVPSMGRPIFARRVNPLAAHSGHQIDFVPTRDQRYIFNVCHWARVFTKAEECVSYVKHWYSIRLIYGTVFM